MPRKPSQSKLEKQIWRDLRKIENRTEREVLLNFKKALNDIRSTLSKTYEKYAKGGKLTNAEMTKYNRLATLHDQLAEILGPTFSKNATLVKRLQRVEYEESFFRHAWLIDQESGVALKWGLLNPDTIRAAVENEFSDIAIKSARQNGILGIRREVTSGLIQGDSYPKMARKIKKFMDKTATNHLTIVRTEGQRSAVAGQRANYDRAEELGVEMQRIWDATLDSRTRPSHGALDGKPSDGKDELGDYWFANADYGYQKVHGPHTEGGPGFTINCRCRLRSQIEGYKPELRRIRGEGEPQKYKTFKQWAEPQGWTEKRGWPKRRKKK